MTFMDYFVSILFVFACFLLILFYHIQQKQTQNIKDLEYLLSIKKVIDEYPEMFENKEYEIEMLDYLIMYYQGLDVLKPQEMYELLIRDETINRRKTYFLGYWVYNRQIVNLDYATLNLPIINQN